ncbi:hypothetical protein [Wohlfahrtiimonas chitiniclastica]|uniref:hypothetical protein n=1 Tax=Wohlfahrtiimonas chitiniclastica TaxID=400946 RepID=UPI00215899B2|nr:hypothetical protein [Wohlfahrtiimonas chitiniclastica]MDC7252347.1 hypothetical protein [Wohlfahrtiimonas chitiniclastica]
MKKSLLAIPLVFSLSHACDMDYVSIGGIKVNCPMEFQDIKFTKSETGFITKEVAFFDTAHVTLVNNRVGAITFKKRYTLDISKQAEQKLNIAQDFIELVTALAKKWHPSTIKGSDSVLEAIMTSGQYKSLEYTSLLMQPDAILASIDISYKSYGLFEDKEAIKTVLGLEYKSVDYINNETEESTARKEFRSF